MADSNKHNHATGGPVYLEDPHHRHKVRQTKRGTFIVEVPNEFATGFVNFLKHNAVVGVAIGFVIGLQAQTLVKQLIASFIDPLFNLVFGEALSARQFHITFHGRTQAFTWGAFVYALLSFIFVLASIYAIYKLFKLDKLEKEVEAHEVDE
ncbi:MAG TPA: MscL family protein [Candidatus Saccharimonadia bacterium]|nr:MscL family protein [Candidatus Saccharimonadia bacterium]